VSIFYCTWGKNATAGSGDAWDMFKRRSWSLGRDKRKHHNKGLNFILYFALRVPSFSYMLGLVACCRGFRLNISVSRSRMKDECFCNLISITLHRT